MKTLKQILIILMAFGIGLIIGNTVDMDLSTLSLDNLSALYNLTDYIDVFWDFFTE